MTSTPPPVSYDPFAVLPAHLGRSGDWWCTPAVQVAAAGHTLAVALQPSGWVPAKYFSLASVFFIVGSTVDRARRASQFQIHPELKRYAGNRAGVDNFIREWMARITLPSLIIGGVASTASFILRKRMPNASEFLTKRLPTGLGLLTIPFSVLVCERGSDAIMDWAFRPLMDEYMVPKEYFGLGGAPASSAAPAEALLPEAEPEDVLAQVDQVLGLNMNPVDKARLAWAMDGNIDSPYPEDKDFAAAGGSSAGGKKGAGGSAPGLFASSALAAAASAKPAPAPASAPPASNLK